MDPRPLLATWAVAFSKGQLGELDSKRESSTACRLRDEDCLDLGAEGETWVETGDLVVWGT